ncbi:NRXN2 [Cordylochernes scorpioides]|uniref:NRXN2 n=1 Tax=Cordylochernes scorpioides TaxID=51811 RepID=A0ABY6LB54_9ARAC|nr:NRXN2 [Cordylochernes scorpioides]
MKNAGCSGRQLSEFNGAPEVQVGGRRAGPAVERGLAGVLAGLVYNRQRVLDLAAEGDPRVTLQGPLELLMAVPIPGASWNSTPPPQVPPKRLVPPRPPEPPAAPSDCWDDDCPPLWDEQRERGLEQMSPSWKLNHY